MRKVTPVYKSAVRRKFGYSALAYVIARVVETAVKCRPVPAGVVRAYHKDAVTCCHIADRTVVHAVVPAIDIEIGQCREQAVAEAVGSLSFFACGYEAYDIVGVGIPFFLVLRITVNNGLETPAVFIISPSNSYISVKISGKLRVDLILVRLLEI